MSRAEDRGSLYRDLTRLALALADYRADRGVFPKQLSQLMPDFLPALPLDIFSGESTGSAWIWENTDGKGSFVEHAVTNTARGHDARVGDVDCDGDLDIVGKPWDDAPSDHVFLQNMTVERGGKPVFTRPAGEVWRPGQTAFGCP